MAKGEKFRAFIEKAKEIVPSIAKAIPQIALGNFVGAMSTVADELRDGAKNSAEGKALLMEFKLRKEEFELEVMKEISSRWKTDMTSDSWLSKNVRPLTLIYLTLSATILIILDSAIPSFSVGEEWIFLLKSLLLSVYLAYFGSRGVEKYKKISK